MSALAHCILICSVNGEPSGEMLRGSRPGFSSLGYMAEDDDNDGGNGGDGGAAAMGGGGGFDAGGSAPDAFPMGLTTPTKLRPGPVSTAHSVSDSFALCRWVAAFTFPTRLTPPPFPPFPVLTRLSRSR